MDTSPELRGAVADWHVAAAATIAAARVGAKLAAAQLAVEPDDASGVAQVNLERAVDDLIAASSNILEGLPVQEDDDAAGRALALMAGSLSVADALAGASDPPEMIIAEHRLLTLSEYGRQTDSDVDLYASVMLGSPSGGADAPPVSLPGELERLAAVAGGETVALATNAIVDTSIKSLADGLAGVFDRQVASDAFDKVTAELRGFVDRLKLAATRIVQWIAEHALQLLRLEPAERVGDAISDGSFSLGGPGDVVGRFMVDLFGAGALRTTWEALADADRPRIDTATIDLYVGHIGWITKCRTAIDRWGARVVLDLARKVPQVQLAYYIVIALSVVFVGSQAALGVGALREALVAS